MRQLVAFINEDRAFDFGLRLEDGRIIPVFHTLEEMKEMGTPEQVAEMLVVTEDEEGQFASF